jgi:hypothetical protein
LKEEEEEEDNNQSIAAFCFEIPSKHVTAIA